MASKKKEKELSYLQVPLPQGQKLSRLPKTEWSGLNRRDEPDQGELSAEVNISTAATPYLTPAPVPVKLGINTGFEYINREINSELEYEYPIMHGNNMAVIDDTLYILRQSGGTAAYHVMVDALSVSDGGLSSGMTYKTGETIYGKENAYDVLQIIPFTYNTNTGNAFDNISEKRLIIPTAACSIRRIKKADWYHDGNTANFPMNFDNSDDSEWQHSVTSFAQAASRYTEYLWIVEKGTADPGDITSMRLYRCELVTSAKGVQSVEWTQLEADLAGLGGMYPMQSITSMPYLKYACTAHGRLFGVDKNKVYASGFNDYANWNLDTSDDYQDSNAWISASQTNTRANGDFTGITAYQNHVVCFKKDHIHEIVNTKNPFRLTDVFSVGTIDNRSIQEVAGLLIFTAADGVYIYNGASPRQISYKLGIDRFTYAVSGSDGRNYYLYCEDGNGRGYVFVYDTHCGCWSQRECGFRIRAFAHGRGIGMYALSAETAEDGGDVGYIYRMDSGVYGNWAFETELLSRGTLSFSNTDIKHIFKVQVMAEISPGAEFKVYALYDGETFDVKRSQLVYNSAGRTGRTAVRVKLRRSAARDVKLHFEGSGFVKIYEAEMFIEKGGDLYI